MEKGLIYIEWETKDIQYFLLWNNDILGKFKVEIHRSFNWQLFQIKAWNCERLTSLETPSTTCDQDSWHVKKQRYWVVDSKRRRIRMGSDTWSRKIKSLLEKFDNVRDPFWWWMYVCWAGQPSCPAWPQLSIVAVLRKSAFFFLLKNTQFSARHWLVRSTRSISQQE